MRVKYLCHTLVGRNKRPVFYSFIPSPLWNGYGLSAGWCSFLRVGRCIYLHVVLGSGAAVGKWPLGCIKSQSTIITWVVFTDLINNSEMILSTIKGGGGGWLTSLSVRGKTSKENCWFKRTAKSFVYDCTFQRALPWCLYFSPGVQSRLLKSSFKHTRLVLKTQASIFYSWNQ